MEKWQAARTESDAEVYDVNGREVKFIWGWATGSQTGNHNKFGTEMLVTVDGEDYDGFSVEAGKEAWDAEYLMEYENIIRDYLDTIAGDTAGA